MLETPLATFFCLLTEFSPDTISGDSPALKRLAHCLTLRQFAGRGRILPNFRVRTLSFSGGTVQDLEPNSLLLIVGPNNSGKSTALSDLESALLTSGDAASRKVVKRVEVTNEGDSEEFKGWLTANYPNTIRLGIKQWFTRGQTLSERDVNAHWWLGTGIHFLCHRLNTRERLGAGDRKKSVATFTQAPNDYIHVLQGKKELLDKVSAQTRAVYGKDVIINWLGAGHVWFHVGDKPSNISVNEDPAAYNDAVSQVPELANEGDGIKSFIGTLLGVYCGAHPVLLIDEPEAFLHPPQARALGRLLAESARETERQIVAATHSPDLVTGALSASANVAVCRIERDGDINRAHFLSAQRLKELWSNPLLQSTGAINGIFHKGVIVCEADADCRFFEALLAKVSFAETPDIYFIHGGGKGAIPTLVRAYRSLNVPVAAITDFDLLREKNAVVGVLDALQAEFGGAERDYTIASAALNELPPIRTVEQFLERAYERLRAVETAGELLPDVRRELSELLSESVKWSEAKKYGIDKLKGDPRQASERLLEFFRSVGLHVVPKGELESWWRAGPAEKSQWIVKVLDEIKQRPQDFKEPRAFLATVCAGFGYRETPAPAI